MDLSLAYRLDASNQYYEAALYQKCAKLASDYVRDGLKSASYFYGDFDSANDLANALASLPKAQTMADFDRLDRSASTAFSHPAGATQVTVLATAVSQILFGGETNRQVQPRQAEDETRADAMNELLAWNDDQQETYKDGYLWVLDSIIFNRGIQYDYWKDQYEVHKEPVEYEIPWTPKGKGKKAQTEPPADYVPEKVTRWKTARKKVGGFTKISNISPYDFVSDPTIPLSRFQESRYAGHRVVLSWSELKRRSELPVDDYEYVLPEVVKKLKNQKARRGITAISPNQSLSSTSRSYFERQRRGNPAPDTGTGDKVNKDDGGTVECWIMTIRTRPKLHGIYEDDEDELIEFLIAGESDLLSVNVMTNEHGDYPYNIAEARPNAHQQFSPSWALIMKPTQNMIDVRKSAHEEQVERCGIMFLADGTKCDIATVLADKTRIRQAILRTPDGEGVPLEQIIQQIEMKDSTASFPAEIEQLVQTMAEASGSNAAMQGTAEDTDQTATQFSTTQQMALGRISTIARNLSTGGLVRQTRRIACNLAQWMNEEQTVRITGKTGDFDPSMPPPKYLTIRRDPHTARDLAVIIAQGLPPEQQAPVMAILSAIPDSEADSDKAKAALDAVKQAKAAADQQAISMGQEPIPVDPKAYLPDLQFQYDVKPHDGAMPGVDQRAVASVARLIEAAANPAFAQVFDPTVEGNFDPKALITYEAEKTGMPVNNFRITRATAQKNAQARLAAQGVPQPGPQAVPAPADQSTLPPGPPGPPAPLQPNGIPSASALPTTPSAAPPQIRPQNA